jgi:hypothetical protein
MIAMMTSRVNNFLRIEIYMYFFTYIVPKIINKVYADFFK